MNQSTTLSMRQSLLYAERLKKRTKDFAIRIVKLYRSLPPTGEAKVIGNQFLRSGTAVAANYRACCRARSNAEFIAKIGVVVEEADETVFWLELLVDCNIFSESEMKDMIRESNELLAIFAASKSTAKANSPKSKPRGGK
jgi:four helix bundle protein